MKAAGKRRKGSRVERELVDMFGEHGLRAKRVPLSGVMQHYKHDVIVEGLNVEVKSRAASRWKVLEEWLGDAHILAVKEDRRRFYFFVGEVAMARLLCAWRDMIEHGDCE